MGYQSHSRKEAMRKRSAMSATLPHFLAFLPENMSSNGEKARLNIFANAKMMMNNITTAIASETFDVIACSRSKMRVQLEVGSPSILVLLACL
jgi:hypothetical protein